MNNIVSESKPSFDPMQEEFPVVSIRNKNDSSEYAVGDYSEYVETSAQVDTRVPSKKPRTQPHPDSVNATNDRDPPPKESDASSEKYTSKFFMSSPLHIFPPKKLSQNK